MNKTIFGISALIIISGCSNTPTTGCEEIVEVKQQQKTCLALKEIMNNRNYPQQAGEARKRFKAECENFRFYRDDFENTICTADEKGKK